MGTGMLLALVVLALVDSTSIGTLFIPVWLLLAPGRVAVGRMLAYLGTIAGFYYVVGLLLVLGGGRLLDALGGALDARPVRWAQLALGVGLFAWSFRFGGKRNAGGGAVRRWRARATAGDSSVGWLAGLALLAAVAEVATMLPYLGAIGLLTTADLSFPAVALLLAGYCVVMVLPAVLLLAARLAWAAGITPLLGRLDGWLARHAGNATGWALGIVGVLIARDAALRLWWPHLLG